MVLVDHGGVRSYTGESVLSRASRILEAFTPDETKLRVSEIARRTGLHVATVSRLVAELVELGLLARDPDRGVRVGVRLWELAMRASPTLTLRNAAMPFMEGVHAVLGHHVQLGVLDGDEVLFVERLSAPGAVVNYSRIAGRLSVNVSSSGMVLLAHGPSDLRERIVSAPGPLLGYTPRSITSPQALRVVLADVRREGFACFRGHVHEDALGVAVPVRDSGGAVVAALSAVLPVDTDIRSVVPLLMGASRGMTRTLSAAADAGHLAVRR